MCSFSKIIYDQELSKTTIIATLNNIYLNQLLMYVKHFLIGLNECIGFRLRVKPCLSLKDILFYCEVLYHLGY